MTSNVAACTELGRDRFNGGDVRRDNSVEEVMPKDAKSGCVEGLA
jgi:hypothetical protein